MSSLVVASVFEVSCRKKDTHTNGGENTTPWRATATGVDNDGLKHGGFRNVTLYA